VDFTEAMLVDHGIECDYVPNGNVIAGIHPGEERKLRKAAEAARALGARVRLLDRDEIEERRLPNFVSCAAIEEQGGVLDPGKYVRGLRQLAIESGATLYEQTGVSEVNEHERGVSLVTPRGTVSSDTVIIATNAYTPGLGLPYGKVIPMRDSQLVTEPLDPQQRESLGWVNGEGIYTTHQSLENYRLAADGRIVGGSRYVSYKFRGRIAEEPATEAFSKIEARFRERFPDLTSVRVEGCWSGHIAMNGNFLPFIGRVGRHGRLLAALGYSGHGLAMSGYLGSVAAGIMQGTDQVPKALEGLRYLPLPPEPLRWLGVRAVTATLELMDRRRDRKAAPRRPTKPDGCP
jgi:gamma-glutamylputrescine oxidase